jgi:hypothetical protein
MNKLVMSALLIGAVPATGCIFVSSDPAQGSVDVTWVVYAEADSGDQDIAHCGPVDSVEIVADNGFDAPFSDIYWCADGRGTARNLPLGDYDVWLVFTRNNVDQFESVRAPANITTNNQVVRIDYDVPLPAQGFILSWELYDGLDRVSCAQVPENDGVSVLSTLSGTTSGIDDIFDCVAGDAPTIAATGRLQPGNYTIDVTMIDANDDVIGEAPELISDSITTGVYTDLTVVEIDLF